VNVQEVSDRCPTGAKESVIHRNTALRTRALTKCVASYPVWYRGTGWLSCNVLKISLDKLQVPLKEAFRTHTEWKRVNMQKTMKEIQWVLITPSELNKLWEIDSERRWFVTWGFLFTELFQEYRKGNPLQNSYKKGS